MSVDYVSQMETLQRALEQFRTVNRSMPTTAVLKGKLSQLRRVLRSAEVFTGGNGPAVVPDDPERRAEWLQLVSIVEASQREIRKSERRTKGGRFCP